jgi:hypothetical protein
MRARINRVCAPLPFYTFFTGGFLFLPRGLGFGGLRRSVGSLLAGGGVGEKVRTHPGLNRGPFGLQPNALPLSYESDIHMKRV